MGFCLLRLSLSKKLIDLVNVVREALEFIIKPLIVRLLFVGTRPWLR
jgi:hypothetical protein